MIRARSITAIVTLALLAMLPLLPNPVGAQQTDRAKQIGGKFMCMCDCNQVLTQCNHVGCTMSAAMLKELDQAVARDASEDAITQMFVQEFGTRVYAEPPKSGLSLVAWVMPFVYLLIGALLVVFVISRWRRRPVPLPESAENRAAGKIAPEILERARAQAARETED
jgi:cytochrome c-type biogenesis protein CcmH/NrfF